MKTIFLKNKKALMRAALVPALAVLFYLGWSDFAGGFQDGYQNRDK